MKFSRPRAISAEHPIANSIAPSPIVISFRRNACFDHVVPQAARDFTNSGIPIKKILSFDSKTSRENIRDEITKILAQNPRTIFLPDDTTIHALEGATLRTPFGHLDTIIAEAVYRLVSQHTGINDLYNDGDGNSEDLSLQALEYLLGLLKKHNPNLNHAIILQTGIAEHRPFSIKLIRALLGAGKKFPPRRIHAKVRAITEAIEKIVAEKIACICNRMGLKWIITADLPANDTTANACIIYDDHHGKDLPQGLNTIPVPFPTPRAYITCANGGYIDADTLNGFENALENQVLDRIKVWRQRITHQTAKKIA